MNSVGLIVCQKAFKQAEYRFCSDKHWKTLQSGMYNACISSYLQSSRTSTVVAFKCGIHQRLADGPSGYIALCLVVYQLLKRQVLSERSFINRHLDADRRMTFRISERINKYWNMYAGLSNLDPREIHEGKFIRIYLAHPLFGHELPLQQID